MGVSVWQQLAIVGGFALVALALVAIGAVRVVTAGLAVKKRTDALKTLPILATLAATQSRLEMTVANLETISRLVARSQVALAEIGAARERVTKLGRTVVLAGRAAAAIATGIARFAAMRNGDTREA